MPFDGFGLPNIQALDGINAVIDLLGVEENWCKGKLHDTAGRYCMRGAIMMQGSDAQSVLEPLVLEAIAEVSGRRYRRIESFNDLVETRHGQIVQILERTRENVIKKAFEQQFPPPPPPPKGRIHRCFDFVFQWR